MDKPYCPEGDEEDKCKIGYIIIASTCEQILAYSITLLILLEIRRLNQQTIALMKTIEDNSMMRRNTEVGQSGELDEYQLPRKVTLFRVVMERKLGIDWEHEPEEEEQNISRMSL